MTIKDGLMSVDAIRLLLVEENSSDARLIQERLAGYPVTLERAETLAAARSFLAVKRVDAVLLDLHLPDSAGLETLKAIRDVDEGVAIVVLTVSSTDALGLEAVKHGADEIVGKSDLEGVILDRTLRHAIERRKLQQQVCAVVWANADAMAVLDPAGRVLIANPAAARLFGTEERALMGGEIPLLDAAGETVIEIPHAEGYVSEVEVRVTPTTWNGQPARIASFHDISARRHTERLERSTQRAERAQQESERQIELLLEKLPVTLWETDEELILRSHRGATFGGSAVDGADEDLTALFPKWGALVVEAHREALRRGEARFEYQHEGRVYEGLVRRRTRDGADSTAAGLFGVAIEVTDRKQLEQQFLHAQKMEAIGRLASGVAHDFNNLLTVILNFGGFVQESLGEGHPATEDILDVLKAAERAGALTRQLLAFSRQQVVTPRLVSPSAQVQETERMLERLIGEDIELKTRLAPDLWNVKIDPGAFEQVLVNLCVNARDAMPDGGALVIETANVDLDEEYCRAHGTETTTPGEYTVVSVTDSGTGMSAEVRERIFEPFFTTKSKGQGTGLGLATCYGIVKQAGGFLWVYSEIGRGTTFKVYLPRHMGHSESEARAEPPPVRGGTETVLVVEDDEQVLKLAVRALTRAGYDVLSASNGAEAKRVSAHYPGVIALLLTDTVMPKMSGVEVSKRLVRARPGMRVLYMSGYAETAMLDRGALDAGAALIQKPFAPEALVRKVREVLDAELPQLTAPLRRKRVVLIEDGTRLLGAVRSLGGEDVEPFLVSRVEAAIDLLDTLHAELILCALDADAARGLEVYEQLQANNPRAAGRLAFVHGEVASDGVQRVEQQTRRPVLTMSALEDELVALLDGLPVSRSPAGAEASRSPE